MTADLPLLTRQTAAPAPGIVHLGLGAFFRSHGAPMIEEALQASGGDWGIIGVSLRSAAIRDKLAPQSHVYTAVEMGPQGQTDRLVEVLSDVVFAPEAPERLLALLADPAIRVVSLTITEKGYCHVPSTGLLNDRHPDILADLRGGTPTSAIGYIVRGLQMRRAAGQRPFTVLSCDNLPDNGAVARQVVTGLAARVDPPLADWITAEGRFPATMVDRIVPATTADNVEALAARTGLLDRAPVFHEPFRQWVIEDSFVAGARPQFDKVPGVQLVGDVAPFELMKIRMLNGTHSALAYLGYLAGHETIAATAADPAFRSFLRRLWRQEIIPTLTPPEGVDLHHYADQLLERYDNPAIRHRTWQIAMDGSQKLPQRLLGTLADAATQGRPCDGLQLAVAAWMRYVGGVDEGGRAIEVRDPLAQQLRTISEAGGTPRETARRFLKVREVFGNRIDPATGDGIAGAYERLVQHGAQSCVARLAAA